MFIKCFSLVCRYSDILQNNKILKGRLCVLGNMCLANICIQGLTLPEASAHSIIQSLVKSTCYFNPAALLHYSLLGASSAAREPRSMRSGKCQVPRSRLQIQWMDQLTARSPSQAHLPASVWRSTSSTQGEIII